MMESKDGETSKRANVIKELKYRISEVERWSENLSIYRVRNNVRKVKEDAYNPRLVSIGLYHEDKHELEGIRELKEHYMQCFFRRAKDSQECLEECALAINGLQKDIRACYDGSIKDMSNNAVDEKLLLDGCFLLELFLRYDQHSNNNNMSPGDHDPIFSSAWIIPALRRDLALLENQIPFFVLIKLHEIYLTLRDMHRDSITPKSTIGHHALVFFLPMHTKAIHAAYAARLSENECKHLLDLLHKIYLPDFFSPSPTPISVESTTKGGYSLSNRNWGFNFSTAELLEAEIECQLQQEYLPYMSFEKGVIRIPPLVMEETTNSMMRNLIAYEQCGFVKNYFTSFAIVLKSLIRSLEDIKLLRQRKIISSTWTADEECLIHFNTMMDEVVVKEFYFFDLLCTKVNAKAEEFGFRRFMKNLYRTYFSTAWSLISFIAASCLFVLTVIQTYFSIRQSR